MKMCNKTCNGDPDGARRLQVAARSCQTAGAEADGGYLLASEGDIKMCNFESYIFLEIFS